MRPYFGISMILALTLACAGSTLQETPSSDVHVETILEEPREPVYIMDSSQVLRSPFEGFIYLDQYMNGADYEMRYFSEFNFVGDTIDGYESAHCIISTEAAKALRKINTKLQKAGFRLKIFDAYRPQRAVNHFKKWSLDSLDQKTKAEYYPYLSKSSLFRLGYIAEQSQHSRGSAVDLTLVYHGGESDGIELDMGTPFDHFGARSGWETDGITDQQRGNREILRQAMVNGGFRSIKGEWWHFVLRNEPFPDQYFDFPIR